jgi:hypothetical protein
VRRLITAAILAALLVVGIVVYAGAQVVQVKHFACYGAGPNPSKNFNYLPNPADPCPPGWTKIDWIDD